MYIISFYLHSIWPYIVHIISFYLHSEMIDCTQSFKIDCQKASLWLLVFRGIIFEIINGAILSFNSMILALAPNSAFDKSVWIGVQTCIRCLGFRCTQLHVFISRSSHSELFWQIGPALKNGTCNYLKCMENHPKITLKEFSFGKAPGL